VLETLLDFGLAVVPSVRAVNRHAADSGSKTSFFIKKRIILLIFIYCVLL